MKIISTILICCFVFTPILFAEGSFEEFQQKMNTQFESEMKGSSKTKTGVEKKAYGNKFHLPQTAKKEIPKVSMKVPDPVAEYLFSGNANDTSGNNNHANVHGALPTEDRGGQGNSAYIFYDRSHRLEITPTPQNTFSDGSFTVSFWVKTKDSANVYKELLTNDNGQSTSWGFKYSTDGNIEFSIENTEQGSSIIAYPINDNKWHQITGLRNTENNTISLFVDGRLIQTKTAITGSVDSGYKITVGDAKNRNFTGRIDDIRMWNEALTVDSLKQIHDRGPLQLVAGLQQVVPVSSALPDPVAKYMFDGNANDTSGNGNHGIVNEAELIEDRAGHQQSAYLFYERDHRIKVPLTDKNTFTNGSFTVSFWIKPSAEATSATHIVSNKAQVYPGWSFKYLSNGNVSFRTTNQVGDTAFLTHPVSMGRWHHVTGVRNTHNNTISLYVNSAPAGTKTGVSGSVNSLGPIYIGEHKNRLFTGRIDDVILWDKPLSANLLAKFHSDSANSLAQAPPYNPDSDSKDDSVGSYSFTGNANDSSAEKNDGIVNAAHLSPDRFGNDNCSYCFTGRDNRIKVPLIEANTFSKGSFTVSFWFKITEVTTGLHALVTNEKGINPEWSFSYSSARKIVFRIQDKEKNASSVMYAIDDNNWHQVTGIRDAVNNKISLYVDNRLVESKTGVLGDVNSGNNIWIGEHTNQLFKGCIDDVVLWKRAFSADEMRAMNDPNLKIADPTGNKKKINSLNKGKMLPKF